MLVIRGSLSAVVLMTVVMMPMLLVYFSSNTLSFMAYDFPILALASACSFRSLSPQKGHRIASGRLALLHQRRVCEHWRLVGLGDAVSDSDPS